MTWIIEAFPDLTERLLEWSDRVCMEAPTIGLFLATWIATITVTYQIQQAPDCDTVRSKRFALRLSSW